MVKLGELNGGYWEYGTYSLYAFDIVLIVFLFSRFLVFLSQPNFRLRRIWLCIGFLELFVFISIVSAYDWKLALYGYGQFLLGIGLFFLLAQIKYDKIKLYWSIIFAGAVQSLLAWQQFFTQSVFASKWLGMASQRAQDLGVSVVESGGERWLRAYGSLPHPNILGGFFAIVLLVNIILYFQLFKKVSAQRLSLVFLIINFLGLFLTFSRGAWLGFTIGIAILYVWSIERYQKQGVLTMAKIILLLALCAVATSALFAQPLSARIFGQGRLETKSITERVASNYDARQIIQNHWLFGTGIKNYGLGVYNEIDAARPAYAYQPAHNVWLLVWAEIGIVGLLLFIVTLLHCYIASWRRRNLEMLALLIALTVMMCFDHWLWSLSFGIYLFWAVIGLAMKETIYS